ncbi:hypothetical protein [Nocardia asteroides]|uniref:hypothetical protein n=1 Tax=Nocardia asteroides TaxID=1824 RepID=UPI0033FEC27D
MSEDTPKPVEFGVSADYPWPRGDHTLAARTANWRSAAHFADVDAGEILRIEGFRQGAELSFNQMIASSSDRSLLVYPFVYGWRHTIELQLKYLIKLFERTEQITVEDGFLKSHNLGKLWGKLHPLAEELIGKFGVRKVEVETTTRIIGQLTTIDPDGQELRYPLRMDGKPSLDNQSPIDLPTFQEALQGASAFLEGLAEVAFQELEYQREMSEEYGP